MKIGQKVAGSLAVILFMMFALGGYSLWSATRLQDDVRIVQSANMRALTAAKAENEYTGAVLEIRRYIADGDEQYSKNFEIKMTNVLELEKQLKAATPNDKAGTVNKLIEDTEVYKNGVVQKLIPILRDQ